MADSYIYNQPYQANGQTLYYSGAAAGMPTTQPTQPAQQTQPYSYNQQGGYTYGAPTTTKPVSLISSDSGQKTVTDNTTSLQRIESTYQGPSIVDYLKSTGAASDYASREKLAAEKGIEEYTGSAEQNTTLLNILRNPTGSPATQKMLEDISGAVGQGGLTGREQQGLNNLVSTQDKLVSATAAARSALEGKDYTSMDYHTKRAEEMQKQLTKELSDYYASIKPLREKQMSLLSPGAREQELRRQLTDLRGQIDQFNLQTEEDKFREFEGQTMGFAGGRASEIDLKASFKRQEMGLKEKNLLASLGMEQEMRKMESDAVSGQLKGIGEDFDLQQKLNERIDKIEESVIERADRLEQEGKKTLSTILGMLDGVDPATIPGDALYTIETLAARAGVPFELVQQALKAQYDRSVLDSLIEVSPGASLYDPRTGKSVYTAPKPATQGSNVPKGYYTATNIPKHVKADLVDDITNTKATLAELYAAYPDVSTSYLSSLFNSLRKKANTSLEDQINSMFGGGNESS